MRGKKGINFGSKNPMWIGGRIISSGGYTMVRCEGHPRATKKGFYVFEHILVIEKKLGRYLKKGEEVHHKNNIKTDNRVSNLMFFTNHSVHNKKFHKPAYSWKKGYKLSEDSKRRISEAKKEWWRKWKIKKLK